MGVDLVALYKGVLEALDEAAVPAELREAAFIKGLELRASRPGPAGAGKAPPATDSEAERRDPLEQIAARFELDVEAVREVFHEDGDNLGIGVAPSRLLRGQAAATKQIALLLAAGRQAGGYDDGYTRVSVVREVCRDFGRLDSSNFSATITEMSEEFTFKGRGQDRQVHVTRPGWAKARGLITSLVDGG